ncbi:MAG: hypothetical protein N3D12_00365 [Candidatus Methanomethyliaceae archaeon]|nr:hypothetical protein [Candidatus Methanomethyliaceae archaeon]
MQRRTLVMLAFITMFCLTIYSGAYASSLSKAEIVHFWVAVPAGNVTEPKTLRGAGPPINMAPIIIDLDTRGLPKNLLNPNVEAISTHWIYNLDKRPYKLGLDLINTHFPVEWEVRSEWPYDPTTHTFTKPLPPGQRIPGLSIDWIFKIPAYYMDEQVIYDGGLLIFDADSGQPLTFIPIKIVRGGIIPSQGGLGSCH